MMQKTSSADLQKQRQPRDPRLVLWKLTPLIRAKECDCLRNAAIEDGPYPCRGLDSQVHAFRLMPRLNKSDPVPGSRLISPQRRGVGPLCADCPHGLCLAQNRPNQVAWRDETRCPRLITRHDSPLKPCPLVESDTLACVNLLDAESARRHYVAYYF